MLLVLMARIEFGESVSNGKYAFKADINRVYTYYCCSNKMYTMTQNDNMT
jgi:hypothetical protein